MTNCVPLKGTKMMNFKTLLLGYGGNLRMIHFNEITISKEPLTLVDCSRSGIELLKYSQVMLFLSVSLCFCDMLIQ